MELNSTNFVSTAENVMKNMQEKDRRGQNYIKLTTSKIRNLLVLTTGLYNEIIHSKEEKLTEEMQRNVQYLKMKFAYECGRENDVKSFVEKAKIFEVIDSIGNSREKLLLFCNYMEALVAYHKFFGGKDR